MASAHEEFDSSICESHAENPTTFGEDPDADIPLGFLKHLKGKDLGEDRSQVVDRLVEEIVQTFAHIVGLAAAGFGVKFRRSFRQESVLDFTPWLHYLLLGFHTESLENTP